MRRASFTLGCAITLLACRQGGGVTGPRLEAALGATFANLVHLQLGALGLPSLPAGALRVRTTCRKIGAEAASSGAGDWSCSLFWFGPDRRGKSVEARTPLEDVFEVSVGADGCYTATAGAESHLGGPTLQAASGATVVNLVYAFDGCFDTTP